MKRWCSLVLFVLLLSGCGGSSTSATPDSPDDPVDPASTTWTEQTLSCCGTPGAVTSTCTITINGNYRMYLTGAGGSIVTTTSTDGLNWGSAVDTGVAESGAGNPSVIALGDGTYLMIYGVAPPMTGTEKLFRATSNDGITFTEQVGAETGGAVLVQGGGDDFVSVPDLISIGGQTLRMYYVSGSMNSRIHTATSADGGQTWTKEGEITLTGSYGGQTNDPDIIQLSDGSHRLFFTTPPAGTQIGDLRIRAATSTDGRNFTVESGDVLDPSGSTTSLLDPDVILRPGSTKYLLYYGTEPAGSLHALLSP